MQTVLQWRKYSVVNITLNGVRKHTRTHIHLDFTALYTPTLHEEATHLTNKITDWPCSSQQRISLSFSRTHRDKHTQATRTDRGSSVLLLQCMICFCPDTHLCMDICKICKGPNTAQHAKHTKGNNCSSPEGINLKSLEKRCRTN